MYIINLMELFHELMCFQRTVVFLKIIIYYTVTFILTFAIHFLYALLLLLTWVFIIFHIDIEFLWLL